MRKDRRERTPFKPSRLTVNASSCVLRSNCAIFILCFGGTSITFVRESSFFKECFPVKDKKKVLETEEQKEQKTHLEYPWLDPYTYFSFSFRLFLLQHRRRHLLHQQDLCQQLFPCPCSRSPAWRQIRPALKEVGHHLKGRHLGVERVGRTCCTQGEGWSERGGPEYLLDAVLVGMELVLTIMISKCSTMFVKQYTWRRKED